MFLHSSSSRSMSKKSKILAAAMEVDMEYRRNRQFGRLASQNSSNLPEGSSDDHDQDQLVSSS